MYYDQLTTIQIEELDKSIPVILPISATEQHGPHLPLSTDRMIGEHFCRAIDALMPEEVLILPIISIGCSEHHTLFAGSLSFRHETLLHQMNDIGHWIHHHGFKNLVIFNSHGGNQAVAGVFLESFGFRHPEMNIMTVTWWKLIPEILAQIAEGGPEASGHAGEFETSLMLFIAPDLVRLEKLPNFANHAEPDWAIGNMLQSGPASLYRNFRQKSPNGVMGTPKLATKEKGTQITEAVIRAIQPILTELKKL